MNRATPTSAMPDNSGRTGSGKSVSAIQPANSVGPSKIPAKISPTTGGCPSRTASTPNPRASSRINARSTNNIWIVWLVMRPHSVPVRGHAAAAGAAAA